MSLIKIDPVKATEKHNATAKAARSADFATEADPLFFKWQAGEGTREEWEAKRNEIRARYPYLGDDV